MLLSRMAFPEHGNKAVILLIIFSHYNRDLKLSHRVLYTGYCQYQYIVTLIKNMHICNHTVYIVIHALQFPEDSCLKLLLHSLCFSALQ